jgi:hypothetical protein
MLKLLLTRSATSWAIILSHHMDVICLSECFVSLFGHPHSDSCNVTEFRFSRKMVSILLITSNLHYLQERSVSTFKLYRVPKYGSRLNIYTFLENNKAGSVGGLWVPDVLTAGETLQEASDYTHRIAVSLSTLLLGFKATWRRQVLQTWPRWRKSERTADFISVVT